MFVTVITYDVSFGAMGCETYFLDSKEMRLGYEENLVGWKPDEAEQKRGTTRKPSSDMKIVTNCFGFVGNLSPSTAHCRCDGVWGYVAPSVRKVLHGALLLSVVPAMGPEVVLSDT